MKATPDCRFIDHLHQASTIPGSLKEERDQLLSIHHRYGNIRVLLFIIAKQKNARQCH
jgi:hypothetical protein